MGKREMCAEKVSANGIVYVITHSDNGDNAGPIFGIHSYMEVDNSISALVENMFFTKAEAIKCCEWLAANEVYPMTLAEVLQDLHS